LNAHGFILGTLFGFILTVTAGLCYYVGRTNTANEIAESCSFGRDFLVNGVVYACAAQAWADEATPIIKPNPPGPRWGKKPP
jgi:hypothetical protein